MLPKTGLRPRQNFGHELNHASFQAVFFSLHLETCLENLVDVYDAQLNLWCTKQEIPYHVDAISK